MTRTSVSIGNREPAMYVLDKTAWEVLNATADDCEDLEQIYRQVCLEFSSQDRERGGYYYRPVKEGPLLYEVADRIRSLVENGLLAPVMDEKGLPVSDLTDQSYVWRAWFRMTPDGRSAWASSEHAALAQQEQSR